MSEQIDPYVKIFVDKIDKTTAKELLKNEFNGEFDVNSMHLDNLIVEARNNIEAKKGPEEDFLFWPIIVELESESEPNALISETSRVLEMLWNSGFPAIAACDFENLLPWNGGIDRDFSQF
ncbi:hypothetical protein [Nocardiopsis alba]|jgi:hypothetical protein|uniref:Uncharacterized protein n=1 Tax=Nocardiopsis alba TaxID=53437 RepID=A0ABV5DVX2_9ACTN